MKITLFLPIFLYIACIALQAPNANADDAAKQRIIRLLEKRNLLAMPSLASQAGSNGLNFNSSEPPLLKTIPFSPLKNIFWRQIDGVNIIDALKNNSASAPFCSEFVFGAENGQSGGLGACFMAESVGYAYKTIVQSGLSFCHTQNLPTKENLQAGGLTLKSGKLPSAGIEKLFSAPSGNKKRTIKLNLKNKPGQDPLDAQVLYLEAMTESQNQKAGNIYKAKLWACSGDSDTPDDYDVITISDSLQFTVKHGGRKDGAVTSLVSSSASGSLKRVGNELIWNSAKKRTVETVVSESDEGGSKSEIEITKNNQMKVRHIDSLTGVPGKGFIILNYTGDSAENLKFNSGAFNEIQAGYEILSAADYNGSFYAIDRQNPLISEVAKADLNSKFFSSGFDVDINLAAFDCNPKVDVELDVDFANPILSASISTCDQVSSDLDNMNFCHNDPEVSSAAFIAASQCR